MTTVTASPTASGTASATATGAAGRLPARAESAGGGTRARSRSPAPRGCPGRPPSPRTAPRPRRRTSPTRPARPAPRTTGSDSPVRLASSRASPSARSDRPVGDHLVARRQPHEIADYHLVDRHPAVDAVADDHRLRRDQRGEPVERALGADLLEGADRDVRDQDPEEERVLPRPEGDRQHAEDEQDPVRDVQRVGADDAGVGAARALARELATRLQRRGLGLGQARERDLGGSGGDAGEAAALRSSRSRGWKRVSPVSTPPPST